MADANDRDDPADRGAYRSGSGRGGQAAPWAQQGGWDGPGAMAPAPLGRGQRLLNMVGAFGSLALVLGLGWWGWDLAMRDARGVPVVRALEGPMRIAPEDPGGQVVDHQGLSVNDVAAEGGVAPPADRLVLAPAPVELTLEDGPGLAAVAGAPAPSPTPGAAAMPSGLPAETPAELDTPEALIPVTPSVSEPDPVALALAEALGVDPSEVSTSAPVGAMAKSLRPKMRPSTGASVAANAAPAAPLPMREVDAATLTPGTRLVQFGAYDSRDQAAAEWTKLTTRFGDLMANKSMVVQSAEAGGQTFWRLRAHGFENEQESRRFCAALEAEGAKCIPVAHR